MQVPSRPAVAFVSFIVLAGSTPSLGAETQDVGAVGRESPADDGMTDARDADSPRAAVREFLAAARKGDFERAARYLDLAAPADRPRRDGPQLARRLKVVLDQTIWIDLESVSDRAEGNLADGMRPQLERIATIETAKGPVDLILQRDPGEDAPWQFSAVTVARIPALYEEFGYGALGEVLPDEFFRLKFLEVQLWQWLGSILLIVLAYTLSWALTWLLYALLRRLADRTSSQVDDQLLDLVAKPARVGIALALFSVGALLLQLAVPAQRFVVGLEKGLAVVVFAWILLRLIDVLGQNARQRLLRKGQVGALSVLPLGEKTVKVIILTFAFLALLQNLGFDATGLLAGLGIGGLALALAAQKTVENLFGGVSVITDQPVRVGEFCRFGDRLGTVEEIGLRSTRVRTLDRTLLSVPNAEFAGMQIENFARRDKIRFYTTLGLRYETTADQLRWVLAELRKLLLSHPRVDADPARVRFVKYGDYSLDLELFCFVKTTDFNEFLAIQEDLLLRIMDVVAESGTGFAFPSSTTYLARDGGIDQGRLRKVEDVVAAWRQRGEMPLPDYTIEAREAFASSIEYPPSGSVLAEAEANR